MHYVYLLKSSIKSWHYIGCTENPKERLKKHNRKGVKSTKAYVPLQIIYCEAYLDKASARKREIELKNNNHQKEILYKRLSIIS